MNMPIKKYISNNYISKDKIRAKIEEFNNGFEMNGNWYNKNFIVELLQELLEEWE